MTRQRQRQRRQTLKSLALSKLGGWTEAFWPMRFRLRVFASNGNSHVLIDANLTNHWELSVRLGPNPAEDASKPSANIGTCAPRISEILHHDEYMPKVRGVDLRWFECEKRAAWAWMLQAGTPCLQQDHVDVLAWASKYAEWCLPDDFEATMNSQQPTYHVLEIASQASCSTPNFQQCQVSYSIRQPANGNLEKRLIENHHNATYTINKDTAFWAETQSDQSTSLINSTWLAPSASPNWALSPSIQSPTLSLLPWALSAVWYLSHNFIVSFQSFHDLNTRNIPKWYPWWRRNCSRWPQSRDSSEASLCTFHIASLRTKVMEQNGTCGHRRKSQPILKHCHIAFNTMTSMRSRWQNWQNWQRKDSLKNPSYAMLFWSSAWPASCCSYDHLISASGSAGVDLWICLISHLYINLHTTLSKVHQTSDMLQLSVDKELLWPTQQYISAHIFEAPLKDVTFPAKIAKLTHPKRDLWVCPNSWKAFQRNGKSEIISTFRSW